MAVARRPLLAAAVVGGLLCGMWFIPYASAANGDGNSAAGQVRARAEAPAGARSASGSGPELADTGSFNTTPYVIGGVGFLFSGSLLLAHAHLRSARLRGAGTAGVTPAAR